MLTEKEKKKLVKLEREMKMHPWKHMFILGIGYGLFLAVFTAVIQVLMDDISFRELLKRKLWINLTSAPLMAIFFGYIIRSQRINLYHQLKGKESRS